MGHKVHPKIFRIGITQDWHSKWYAHKDYAKFLEQDIRIRKFIKNKLRNSGIASVDIERSGKSAVNILIYTSKPGMVIGRRGQGAEDLKKDIEKRFLPAKTTLNISIQEVQEPNLNAELVCQNIIEQIEKRIPFRRTVKQALDQVMKNGAKGVKILIGGRLDGSEIARQEKFLAGSVPLHTLRADINYSRGAADTTYGAVGVKVWIYKGEVFKKIAVKL